MKAGYAHLCVKCGHLTSHHYLVESGDLVAGPYLCTHRDCVCTVSQTDPATAISKAQFDQEVASTLDEYEDPA